MGAGRSRCSVLRCEPPLTFRATDPDQSEAHLTWVGTTAGPLGGDDLAVDVVVEPGAHAVVRSAGAALVLPGPHGLASRLDLAAEVGDRATLIWAPEPTVLAEGSSHAATTRIDLATGSELVWVDELVLGRHASPSGRCTTRLLVEVGGRPLLRTGLDVGPPGWDGPAVLGGARYVAQVLAVGPASHALATLPAVLTPGLRAASTALGGSESEGSRRGGCDVGGPDDAHLLTVAGDDVVAARDLVASAVALARRRVRA